MKLTPAVLAGDKVSAGVEWVDRVAPTGDQALDRLRPAKDSRGRD